MRFATAMLLAAFSLGACGTEDEAGELRDFLRATGPASDDPARLDYLNGVFARQSARGAGYVSAGVTGEELWSPMLAQTRAGVAPVDVTAWTASGVLSADGRFVPAQRTSALVLPALTPELAQLAGAELRLDALAAALAELRPGLERLAWAPPSDAAVVFEGPVAHVNPRLLLLVPGAGAAEIPGQSTSATAELPEDRMPEVRPESGGQEREFHSVFLPSFADCEKYGIGTPFVWLVQLVMLIVLSPFWLLFHLIDDAVGCSTPGALPTAVAAVNLAPLALVMLYRRRRNRS